MFFATLVASGRISEELVELAIRSARLRRIACGDWACSISRAGQRIYGAKGWNENRVTSTML